MFTLTQHWLEQYYGSHGQDQHVDAKAWLLKYGKDIPPDVNLDDWANWKHLVEYQPNTPDIITQAIKAVGSAFPNELAAHVWINRMRVPMSMWYSVACDIAKPATILELGVGGDSGISTSNFMAHLNGREHTRLVSVDHNPLGMTARRFGKFPNWTSVTKDSIEYLKSVQGARFGMVFIDTSHSYEQTAEELALACHLTRFMLMDDCLFPGNTTDKEPGGVKRAIEEFLEADSRWLPHPEIPSSSNIMLLCQSEP